ncbi:MAG TPA: hypothetical protein VJQ43_00505 [Thermoplasmata archaeon]|nr:hypothetical protein [Thermoplasmata archaeon]
MTEQERPEGRGALPGRFGSGRPRFGIVRGGVASASLALLVLISGSTTALPLTAHTLSAPFAGTVTTSNLTSTVACGKATVFPAPHFSLPSGHGGFGERSTAWSCGPSSVRGDVAASIAVTVPLPFSLGTAHQVLVNASAVARQVEKLVGGNCTVRPNLYSYCYVFANQSLSVQGYLVDTNTGARFPSANGWTEYNFSSIYVYSTAGSGNASISTHYMSGAFGGFALYFNGTWSAHHRFALELDVQSVCDAVILWFQSTLSGASVAQTLDFASPGNGVTVHSISVA